MPKGIPLTDEQKAKMAEGRRQRRLNKLARKLSPDESVEVSSSPPPDAGSSGDLSDEERDLIRRKVEAQIEKEILEQRAAEREARIATELEDELLRARVDAGLVTIDHRQDLITFIVDVAPYSDGLLIDGVRYAHGYECTVPRAKYDSMRETMARTWDHEENCGYPNKRLMRPRGPTNTFNTTMPHAYLAPHQTTISERTMAVHNQPIITRR